MVSMGSKMQRVFDPEFIGARKDISAVMLNAAKGNLDFVAKACKENEHEVRLKNRDGNTLLLLAVGNRHVELTNFLLEIKSDLSHKNTFQMDALDYATMDGLRTPIAKAVLSHCDYVVPGALDGPFYFKSDRALTALREDDYRLAPLALCGQTPDFSDIFAKETEYRRDWVKSLTAMSMTVRRGMLLLDNEVGYLERDSLLTGCLELPMERRYVYCPSEIKEERKVISFSRALRTVYAGVMEERMVAACSEGDAMAVQGLLRAKAHPNIQDVRGQTVLMWAAHNGSPLVLKCLLHAKAQVNTVNKEGFSAFILAAVRDHDEAARILIRAKADLNTRSYKGNTAIDFAKHEGHRNILKVITEERESQREAQKQSQQKRK